MPLKSVKAMLHLAEMLSRLNSLLPPPLRLVLVYLRLVAHAPVRLVRAQVRAFEHRLPALVGPAELPKALPELSCIEPTH